MKKLSIVIPVYNEEKTVAEVLDEILKVKVSLAKEIIIVNDGSTDNSGKVIASWIKKHKRTNVLFHEKPNGGKGSAVREGIRLATGDIVIIQDADLEYNPHEYQSLVDPILAGKTKVVYGSRVLKKENTYSTLSFLIGGRLVTAITNLLFFARITDEPTCYKVFHKDVIKNVRFVGNHFEWEPEVTAKVLRQGYKIHEVPISYTSRTIAEGKKINWRDGLQAIYTLFYWRFKKFE